MRVSDYDNIFILGWSNPLSTEMNEIKIKIKLRNIQRQSKTNISKARGITKTKTSIKRTTEKNKKQLI